MSCIIECFSSSKKVGISSGTSKSINKYLLSLISGVIYDSEVPDQDLAYCKEVHGEVSRTFDLALDNLSGPLEDAISVSYLMCRIPDTVEDSSVIPSEQQVELLDQYEGILNGSDEEIDEFVLSALEYRNEALNAGEDEAYWDLLENTERVFNVFESFDEEVKRYAADNIGDMTEGMKEICARSEEGIRIHDRDEFEQYYFYVAGTVGNLLTDLFVHQGDFDPETEQNLREYAEDFGEGLQTVNIIKDVKQDYLEEDAIFLPEAVLQDNNASQSQLEAMFEGEDVDSELFEDAMQEMVFRSKQNMEKASRYIQNLPEDAEDIRRWAMTPYLLAVATLREAEERSLEPLEEEGVKISKNEALTITEKVDRWESENSIEEITELVYNEEQTSLKNSIKLSAKDALDRIKG